MKKVWSISTTLRNPERIRNFLIALQSIEGQTWDHPTQKKFQILLIQNKFYGAGSNQFYQGLSPEYVALLDSPNPISYEQAEQILEAKRYEGGGEMRGRNSFKPIEKMGLAAIGPNRSIVITPLGKYLLQDEYDLGEMFFKSFLKWQYPNPTSRDFSQAGGYDIKPFVGTMHLINRVNQLCTDRNQTVKGISMIEFRLFVPTLINYLQIEEWAQKLLEFRVRYESQTNERSKKDFIDTYISENFQDYENATYKNLGDYADNTLRYFRMTRYMHIRGGGFYIDLEPRRSVEINRLLETDDAKSLAFTLSDYNEYISDINKPVLPWEEVSELREIATLTTSDIKDYVSDLESKNVSIPAFDFLDHTLITVGEMKSYIESLRGYRRLLQETEDHFTSQSVDKVKEYIERLKNIRTSREKKPIELEHLTTLALNALNDALAIRPNYPVGDDNSPTFTAPANKPDIECFYESFDSVCEVTMLTDRAQWYNEGQPVMRHVRDFELRNTERSVYCLFIAPTIHRDTINTFWTSVKYEYEGQRQKIVPLSISQFVKLLEALVTLKEGGRRLRHSDLMSLYDEVINTTQLVQSSDLWLERIPAVVEGWCSNIVAR